MAPPPGEPTHPEDYADDPEEDEASPEREADAHASYSTTEEEQPSSQGLPQLVSITMTSKAAKTRKSFNG